MAEGVTFYDGADKPVQKVPEGRDGTGKTGSGPIDFFKGAPEAPAASVPKNPTENLADVKVGKGNPVVGPMDK